MEFLEFLRSHVHLIFGLIVGITINHLIIKPIEKRKAREWCIRHGNVPYTRK